MLIRSLEQFLACAGCSSNVPYCSSPRSSSALMLLRQLLKSDKLSIFSIASQKATNSVATKLLISMVSLSCLRVFSLCIKRTDIPLRLCRVVLSAHCAAHDQFPQTHSTAPSALNTQSGKPAHTFCGYLFANPVSAWHHHGHCHKSLQATATVHRAPSVINVSVTLSD